MCIVYVYDIIFWARNEDGIHDLEMELRELGVDLEQEDDADGFICVNIERDLKTGLLDMKQIGLIQRVINAVVRILEYQRVNLHLQRISPWARMIMVNRKVGCSSTAAF